jgi:hypothetical protein
MTQHEIEKWSPFKAWLYSLFYRNPKSNLAVVGRLQLTPTYWHRDS